MEMKHCHSCGMPVSPEAAVKNSDDFCHYCVDKDGQLKAREEIQAGIAQWLRGITPKDSSADYMKRADHYLKAMPAWAE